MEDVFEKVSAHFIKGMMFHDSMANYYDFLNLRGYKRFHEYQFLCDTKNYRKLNRYYINHHSRLVSESEFDEPNVIPDSWYRYKREEVDTSTKKNAIETAMQKYVEWEKETKDLLEKSIKELYDAGAINDACFLKKMLKKVSKELKYAERKKIELSNINYDLDYIMQEQKCIHDKYMEKIK